MTALEGNIRDPAADPADQFPGLISPTSRRNR
jgi:hypothetical protein